MAFRVSSELYTELLDHRGICWRVFIAACQGLSGVFSRAQSVLGRLSKPDESLLSDAKAALDLGTRGSSTVPKLVESLEATLAAGSSPGIICPSSTLYEECTLCFTLKYTLLN